MRHTWFLLVSNGAKLLALVLFMASAAPAIAAPDLCADIPYNLSPAAVSWLRSNFVSRFPAREARKLNALTVAESLDDNQLSLSFDRNRNRLVVPPRFFALQCRMILLQTLHIAEPGDFEPIRSRIPACIKAGGKRGKCLDTAIGEFVDSFRFERTKAQLKNTSLKLRDGVLVATQFQLAHEASHALMFVGKSREEIRRIDAELEADLQAELSIFGNSGGRIAPLYVMASASLTGVDDSLHGSPICRLERMQAVLKKVGLGLSLIATQMASEPGSNDVVIFAHNVAEIMPAAYMKEGVQPFLIGDAAGECDPVEEARIDDLRTDVDRILDATQPGKTDRKFGIPDLDLAEKNLASLVPQTAAGARIRMMLRFKILLHKLGFSIATTTLPAPASVQNAEDTMSAVRAIMPTDGENFMAVDEVLPFLLLQTMIDFYGQPAGSGLLANTRKLQRRIDELDLMQPLIEQAQNVAFLDLFSPATAPDAKPQVQQRLDFELMAGTILGDCQKMYDLNKGVSEALGEPVSAALNGEACRNAGRLIGERISKARKWRFDIR